MEKSFRQTCKDNTIYKIIYSRILRSLEKARKLPTIKARPAGLEPATPCLEGRFGRIMKIPNSLGKIELLYSSRYGQSHS